MSRPGTRPLIGVTTYRQVTQWWSWDRDAALVPGGYLDTVVAAGGWPVLLAPLGEGVAEEGDAVAVTRMAGALVDALDGLVVIGGGDVAADRYGHEADERNGGVNPFRDELELQLLDAALDRDLPVLAICRGHQVLNVLLGGTLVQQLPDLLGSTRHQPQAGAFGEVTVVTEPGTIVRGLLGERPVVLCSHHQAIEELGDALLVSARSDDGVIEAVEVLGRTFAVGVQWHPEEQGDVRLFAGLVDAARQRTGRKSATEEGAGMSDVTDVVNPATEQVIARIPINGVEATDEAVARAHAAGPAWRAVAPADRARLMRRFAATVEDHHEELAQLETANVGKPIGESRDEVAMVAEVLYFYAGAVDKHRGATVPVAGGVDMTFHEPLGVVGAIIPWNFPVAITSWKVGPALATGNTIVVKPAEITPLTAVRLAELGLEAGLPEGVLQVVTGKGSVVGTRLAEHPDVAKIAFTGSTEVGRDVMSRASGTIKRVTLELGGKSASVVFADADLDRAAASAPGGMFANAGQDCCARSRILIQRRAMDEFLDLLADAVRAWTVGDPTDPDIKMGPMVTAAHRGVVAGFMDEGMGAPGGPVASHTAGAVPDGPGYWFPPTVVAPADPGWRMAREEIFGPIVAVIPFDDEDEAVRLANDTPYGLSGSIWTRDGARSLRMARAVQAGNLSVNSNSSVRVQTSFGGMKQSGFGRELGLEALASYTEVKNVFVSTDD